MLSLLADARVAEEVEAEEEGAEEEEEEEEALECLIR